MKLADVIRKAYADEPYKNFKFLVEISGGVNFARAGFNKVSGLKADVAVIEYREGGDNLTNRKYPGQISYDPITLERGLTADGDAMSAFNLLGNAIAKDQTTLKNARLNVTIILQDRAGNTAKEWLVPNAWISTYETDGFDAEGNDVVIEKITFQHEGFQTIQ